MKDTKTPQIPEKVIVIETTLNEEFYLEYLRCIKGIHKLTEGQMKILAAFLYKRHLLSKEISNPNLLDSVLLGKDTRREIREAFDMSSTHFQVIMSKFKEKGIIVNGTIYPKLIPSIDETQGLFKLAIYLKFNEK